MTNDPEEGSVQYIILLPVQSSGIFLSELNKRTRNTMFFEALSTIRKLDDNLAVFRSVAEQLPLRYNVLIWFNGKMYFVLPNPPPHLIMFPGKLCRLLFRLKHWSIVVYTAYTFYLNIQISHHLPQHHLSFRVLSAKHQKVATKYHWSLIIEIRDNDFFTSSTDH